jgi:hypothetical protein
MLSVFSTKAPSQLNVEEVLDRFAQNHNKLRSFIVKCDTQSEGIVDLPPKAQEELSTRATSEYRFDGDRICYRFDSIIHGVPQYNSQLWDGNSWYDQTRPKGKPGKVIITARRVPIRDKARLSREKEISPWLGYLYGADERIDTILREAIKRGESVSAREERIRGSNCNVITAMTKHGKYTVWLDAEKDYNVVKAIVEKRPGDLAYDGPPLTEGDYCYYSVDYVQYKKQGDTWLPQKVQCEMKGKTSGGHFEYVTKYNFREVILDPDHEALRSFVPDDIMNGARVYFYDVPQIKYTWQDGKLIPNVDEAVIAEIDKMTEEIMAKGEVPPSLKAKKEPGTVPATVSDLLDKYAASQDKLKSFIAKAESKIEYTETTSRTKNETCEFRTDGDRVCHRSFLLPGRADYKSFLWDGKSLIEYKQQSPALGGYRVFIENKDESKKKLIATQYKGAALMGICAGDYERVDSILRKSDTISVLDRTERVGDANCYVIDAATKRGRYKLWLDPQHDYNIAKMEVQRKKGDLVRNTGRVETSMSFVLDGVGFKKVGDVWVSMEADMRQEEDNRAGVVKWHHKRIEMVLNPDHNALHSFVADDIPDGTKVSISGLANTEYTWRNGKPVQE